MDLRVEAERAGCRRLRALVDALPLDAMLWRSRDPQTIESNGSAKVAEVANFFNEHIH